MKKKGVDLHDFSEYGLYCRERIGNVGLGKRLYHPIQKHWA